MGTEPRLGNQARGAWGEEQAARWYRDRGYEVLDRNWRTVEGELDLVLGRPGLVVVCEVKARRTDAFGPPAAAVTVVKQQRIRRLAAAWLRVHDHHGVDVRFDVAAVLGTTVEVIESAF